MQERGAPKGGDGLRRQAERGRYWDKCVTSVGIGFVISSSLKWSA